MARPDLRVRRQHHQRRWPTAGDRWGDHHSARRHDGWCRSDAARCLGTSGWAAAAELGFGQACSGFGLGFGNSHEMSYRQALTPDELQARTNTTMRSFNRAVIVVVAPLGGLLAVQAGNRSALVAAPIVFAAAVVLLAASPFRTVRHDSLTSPAG